MAFKIKRRKNTKMSKMTSSPPPNWVEDTNIRAWVDWAISLVGPKNWMVRKQSLMTFAQGQLPAISAGWEEGTDFASVRIAPEDRSRWYLYQAELYLKNPYECDLPQASRILPVVHRLGARLEELNRIPGAVDRMRRVFENPGVDIDSALFELTVASALP